MDITSLLQGNPIARAQACLGDNNYVGPHDPILIDEEIENRAIEQTDALFHRLIGLRDKHGLPNTIESIRLVLETYAGIAHGALIEREFSARLIRRFDRLIPIESKAPLLPGSKAILIDTTIQSNWLDIERIVIEGRPEHWRIHDLRIGNESQLDRNAPPGGISGEMFREGGLLSQIKLQRIYSAMYLGIQVQYVGPRAEGEVFRAVASGKSER